MGPQLTVLIIEVSLFQSTSVHNSRLTVCTCNSVQLHVSCYINNNEYNKYFNEQVDTVEQLEEDKEKQQQQQQQQGDVSRQNEQQDDVMSDTVEGVNDIVIEKETGSDALDEVNYYSPFGGLYRSVYYCIVVRVEISIIRNHTRLLMFITVNNHLFCWLINFIDKTFFAQLIAMA